MKEKALANVIIGGRVLFEDLSLIVRNLNLDYAISPLKVKCPNIDSRMPRQKPSRVS